MIKQIIIALFAAVVIYVCLPGIYSLKALFAYTKQDTEKAIKLYEKAYKTGRASEKSKIYYALITLRNAEPEKAVKIFNEVISSPKAKETFKNSAKQYRCLAYIKSGDAKTALEDSQELLSKYKNTDLYATVGYAMALNTVDPSELLKFCEEAYEYNGDSRDIADNYAVALIKSGNYSKAIEICNEVIEKDNYFPEGHFHKAQALVALEKFEDALGELEMLEDCDFKYMSTVSEEDAENLRQQAKGKP